MKLRILVEAHVFDNGYEGVSSFIRGLYTELAGRSDIQLFIIARDPANLVKHFPSGSNIVFLRYRMRFTLLRLLFEIPALISKHKIDFAHFQYISPLIKNCKYIVTTHDILFKDFPSEFPWRYRMARSFLFRLSCRRADILTTVSEYSKQSIAKHFGITPQKIRVIPNGVECRFFDDFDHAKARKHIRNKFGPQRYILVVSRIEPRKNHTIVLESFCNLKLFEKGYQLVFIGKTGISYKLFRHQMGLIPAAAGNSVFMIQQVEDDDLVAFYLGAELVVYPSKAEGFGIPPLEAAALKVPVLCSDTTAMSAFDFFGNHQFNPLDREAFEQKLSIVLNEPMDTARKKEIADTVKNRFNWSRSADLMYQILKPGI